MKIIDLLNKIANGEEVPKKFRYKGSTYIYKTYTFEDGDEMTGYGEENGGWINIWRDNLNDEVEIIKEDKELKKIEKLNNVGNSQNLGEFADKQQLNNHILKNKINEIIDYLKSKGDELPIEIYNDLIGQIEEAQKERNEYKQLYENGLKVNQNSHKYITELEMNNAILKEEINTLKSNFEVEIDRLQQENEKLLKKSYKDDVIITKAIEYIMSDLITEWDIKNDGYVSGSDLSVDAIIPILNILNGSDEK